MNLKRVATAVGRLPVKRSSVSAPSAPATLPSLTAVICAVAEWYSLNVPLPSTCGHCSICLVSQ